VRHRLYCPNSTTNFFSVFIAVTVTVAPSTPQRKSQPCRETINSGLLGCVPRSRWYVRIRTRWQAANAVAGGAAPPPCMARSSRAARVEISASIRAPEGIRRGRHRQRQRHHAGKNRDGAILCSTRRGESRRTAAPLTLTLTPLYAPDPDSDASVRGAAHPGTGNATKLICQSITFGSLLPLPCPAARAHHGPHGDPRDTWRRTCGAGYRVTPGAGPGSGLSPRRRHQRQGTRCLARVPAYGPVCFRGPTRLSAAR
jgi:hypothetical protein